MLASTGIFEVCTGPTLAMTVVALALVWMIMSFYSKVFNSRLPPLPAMPFPVVGNSLQMHRGLTETIAFWRKAAGDVYRFYVGSQIVIVISGYDTIKEVFVKHADKFSDRESKFDLMINFLPKAHKGIAMASGANWKEQRTVLLQILRNFGMGKNIIAERIEKEVEIYLDKLVQLKGRAKNIQELTSTSVSNVICSITLGKRFDLDDPYFLEVARNIHEQTYLIGKINSSLLSTCRWLAYLPGDIFGIKKLRHLYLYALEYFAQRHIDEQRPKIGRSDEVESLITEYLKEKENTENQNVVTHLDEENLRIIVYQLFFAGTETTTTTLMWYMLFMINYPNIQKKVFAEIEEKVGTERAPTIQDKLKLKYLQAVLMETQRVGNVAPLGLQRGCSETVEIRGYIIPKGSTVLPNLTSVLTDEKIWGDPENFRPERFLDSEGNLVHREELIPFSIGRRACVGESLAKMELFLFAAGLTQRFELLPEKDNCPPPIQHIWFGLGLSPKPFALRIRERR